MSNAADNRQQWRRALMSEDECLSVDQLSGELTPAEQQHLDICSRCQSELLLWQEFQNPSIGDDTDVEGLTDELARRLANPAIEERGAAPVAPARKPFVSWQRWAAAAVVVLATGLIYGVLDREPGLTPGVVNPVYRGEGIELVSPRGDIDGAPATLEWRAVAGAARYDVRVLEVDGTELWSVSSATPGVAIPPEIARTLVPGKTVSWDVSAVDQDGVMLIRSTRQPFRVKPPAPPVLRR